eukprot:6178021-Pleurochrysis_carterae.AAC.1
MIREGANSYDYSHQRWLRRMCCTAAARQHLPGIHAIWLARVDDDQRASNALKPEQDVDNQLRRRVDHVEDQPLVEHNKSRATEKSQNALAQPQAAHRREDPRKHEKNHQQITFLEARADLLAGERCLDGAENREGGDDDQVNGEPAYFEEEGLPRKPRPLEIEEDLQDLRSENPVVVRELDSLDHQRESGRVAVWWHAREVLKRDATGLRTQGRNAGLLTEQGSLGFCFISLGFFFGFCCIRNMQAVKALR